MDKRIRELRKALNLTQQGFADGLGIARNNIAGYETGRRLPSDAVISLICKTFSVSESWLRTGNGEMFARKSVDGLEEYARLHGATDLEIKILKAYFDLPAVVRSKILQYFEDRLSLPPRDSRFDAGPGPKYDTAPSLLDRTEKLRTPTQSQAMTMLHVYDQPAAAGFGNYFEDASYHTQLFNSESIPPYTSYGVRISGDSMEPKIPDGSIVFVAETPMVDSGEIGIFSFREEFYCKKLIADDSKHEIRLVSLNSKYADIVIGEDDADLFRPVGRVLGYFKTND